MKQMFQKLCNGKGDREAPLHDDLKSAVQGWIVQLEEVKSVVVPRCYQQAGGEINSVELLGFGGASKAAFGAVVFIRIETNEDCFASLVYSKARFAPLESQSIPRLEFLVGLTLARRVATLKSALQPITRVDNVYCWLDSLTAIYWILQERKE